jgi:hypothetical protein
MEPAYAEACQNDSPHHPARSEHFFELTDHRIQYQALFASVLETRRKSPHNDLRERENLHRRATRYLTVGWPIPETVGRGRGMPVAIDVLVAATIRFPWHQMLQFAAVANLPNRLVEYPNVRLRDQRYDGVLTRRSQLPHILDPSTVCFFVFEYLCLVSCEEGSVTETLHHAALDTVPHIEQSATKRAYFRTQPPPLDIGNMSMLSPENMPQVQCGPRPNLRLPAARETTIAGQPATTGARCHNEETSK